jgi:type I restriction enzyme S subunit
VVFETGLVYVSERHVSSEQRLRAGDIVIATSSGSKHLVGKSAQLYSKWDGSFGAFCAAIRPKPHIEPRYLAFFMQSPDYWKQIRKKALGVNINNLRRGDLESLSLALPPVDKQRRIVAEIEKQFSRLDEAIANLKRVKANLKRYKAAVLKAAVEGRLVPTEAELARKEGRTYETGEQLLARILQLPLRLLSSKTAS